MGPEYAGWAVVHHIHHRAADLAIARCQAPPIRFGLHVLSM